MQIKIFTLPLTPTEEQTEELNRFLRGHRVIDLKSRFYELVSRFSFRILTNGWQISVNFAFNHVKGDMEGPLPFYHTGLETQQQSYERTAT